MKFRSIQTIAYSPVFLVLDLAKNPTLKLSKCIQMYSCVCSVRQLSVNSVREQ